MVLAGHFSVGILIAFNAYKNQFNSRASALIDKFTEIKVLRLQGERLADIVMTSPERLQGIDDLNSKHLFDPVIEVNKLRYRYADQEPYVLDGISFKITAGESVAIIGPSGCGKSTLLNVLLGILPATEGNVTLGGVSLHQIGFEALRQAVGTVLQDDVLFAGSIKDNISFFDPEADQSWIEECAHLAVIYDEITAMPMSFNTLVGDMGTVLSGGQKQRVLLARALYKKPKILFLDEATSHLDITKEREVNAAVRALNITRIIIAHRPETIVTANRLIVLDGGKIVQDSPLSVFSEKTV